MKERSLFMTHKPPCRNTQARMVDAMDVSEEERWAIVAAQGDNCFVCGRPVTGVQRFVEVKP